jgi:hypothetical protein
MLSWCQRLWGTNTLAAVTLSPETIRCPTIVAGIFGFSQLRNRNVVVQPIYQTHIAVSPHDATTT